MPIEASAMGEQPIYTCKAHVFHIDPKTKRSWVPASNSSVSVSFFYDSSRNLHRIISVEGTKAIINSTVVPTMVFTKTSQKFGQWSDVRANTVYGLGFSTELDLNKFVDKFQEICELSRLAMTQQQQGSSDVPLAVTVSASTSVIGDLQNIASVSRKIIQDCSDVTDNDNHVTPGVVLSVPVTADVLDNGDKVDKVDHSPVNNLSNTLSRNPSHRSHTVDSVASVGGSNNTSSYSGSVSSSLSEAQLRYENDRLKLALSQSSANAKKWDIELATMKNNNARLTSALQSSNANVDEWTRQLNSYKEELTKARARVTELESQMAINGTISTSSVPPSRTLEKLKISSNSGDISRPIVNQSTGSHDAAEQNTLSREPHSQMCLTAIDNGHSSENGRNISTASSSEIKILLNENEHLRSQCSRLQVQLEISLNAQNAQRKVIDTLNVQLADKISDLKAIHSEINQAVQT